MRLPVQAQPVARNMRTIQQNDNSGGVKPSWGGWNPGSWVSNPGKTLCQAGCRATQVAAVGACNGNPVCIALAVQKGEDCFSDC
jgi:hypothetical protein